MQVQVNTYWIMTINVQSVYEKEQNYCRYYTGIFLYEEKKALYYF